MDNETTVCNDVHLSKRTNQKMLRQYFKSLYLRTMTESYAVAQSAIIDSLSDGGACLDCGAHNGDRYHFLNKGNSLAKENYFGVEWNADAAEVARRSGLNVVEGDLNKRLTFSDDKFKCIFGLSVLEHLLNPCHFLKESFRCLRPDGTLVILTPNISTYFTIALLLAGKMPSSGPHPDSDLLVKNEELFKVSSDELVLDTEMEKPVHRHLVVFSFRVLKKYLHMLGFKEVKGYGFGLYPFPNFAQPLLEKIDPYHCHQMVFVARK